MDSESAAAWTAFLGDLEERGLRAENGLVEIISDGGSGLLVALDIVHFGVRVRHQRCLFHVLRNVRDAVPLPRGGKDGPQRKAAQATRRAVVQAAAAIYDAPDEAGVREGYAAFVATWQASQPKAVAVLEGVFEATLPYLRVQEEARARGQCCEVRYLRTTSALERLNRRIRRMARAVTIFHSQEGLDSRLWLLLGSAGALLTPGDDWQEVVELALSAA